MHPLIKDLDAQIHAMAELQRRIAEELDPEDVIGVEEGLAWLKACRMTLNQKLHAQSHAAL